MQNAPVVQAYMQLVKNGRWYGAMQTASTRATAFTSTYEYPLADVPITFDDYQCSLREP